MCIRTTYVLFPGGKNWSPTRIRFNFWDTKNTFQPKVEQNIKKPVLNSFQITFTHPKMHTLDGTLYSICMVQASSVCNS